MTHASVSETERTQLEVLLFGRTYLYTMFHKLFGGQIDSALLDELEGTALSDVVDEYAAENQTFAALQEFLDGLRSADQAQLLDAARDEYTRVFIGPAALPASPYEAPYTGRHDMTTFQENTIKVRRIYAAAGLQAKRLQRVPDDHISLECAFVAAQARQTLEAFRAGKWQECAEQLRAQGAFVQNHMANWFGAFAKAVRGSKAAANPVLFPQMLEAAAAFVTQDVTFTVEAAYWADENVEAAQAFEAFEALGAAQASLDMLAALHLTGIEDNELVSI